MKSNCPVCDKAGLPDYTKSPTICPQCNSDLTPLLLLTSISKPKKSYLFAFVTTGVFSCLIIMFFLYSHFKQEQIVVNNSHAILELEDSIKSLELSHEKQTVHEEKKSVTREVVISYKVKARDCTSVIAQFFYNDWKMYKKIEADNNLNQPYSLKVGQILTIKLTQD